MVILGSSGDIWPAPFIARSPPLIPRESHFATDEGCLSIYALTLPHSRHLAPIKRQIPVPIDMLKIDCFRRRFAATRQNTISNARQHFSTSHLVDYHMVEFAEWPSGDFLIYFRRHSPASKMICNVPYRIDTGPAEETYFILKKVI